MITYLDRVCFGSVAGYIQHEFGLSDAEKGYLQLVAWVRAEIQVFVLLVHTPLRWEFRFRQLQNFASELMGPLVAYRAAYLVDN